MKWNKREKIGANWGYLSVDMEYHIHNVPSDKKFPWKVYKTHPNRERPTKVGEAVDVRTAKLIAEKDDREVESMRRSKLSSKPNALPTIPEKHFIGIVSIENLEHLKDIDLTQCDFGIQTHNDGRVWICLNGVAFLRFKPIVTDQEVVEFFPIKGK